MMKKECHDYIPNPNNPHCRDKTVEVVQEAVSYPRPNDEETKEAVQELMNELNVMDQATKTPPRHPPLPEDDNEPFKRMVRLATMFHSPPFSNWGLLGLPSPSCSSGGARVPKWVGVCQMFPSFAVCCFVLRRRSFPIWGRCIVNFM